MDIYVGIDIRDGKCVRLTQGDFARETIYFDDPADAAQQWVDQGADWLHVVDLDGARKGERVNGEVIKRVVASAGTRPVEVSGGIRSLDAVGEVLDAGAARVVLGTAAVRDPDMIVAAVEKFPARVAVGVDAKAGEVVIEGWRVGSACRVETVAESAAAAGVASVIYTDVTVDGTLRHPNVGATSALVQRLGCRLPVIASGGVGQVADVTDLRGAGAAGVIIGRALYTGTVRLADVLAAAHGSPC